MRCRLLLRSAAVIGVGLLPVVAVGGPAAAGGGGCYSPATEGTGTTVEMREACFTPSVLRVDEGATVTFVNRDDVTHAVVGIGWGSFEMLQDDEMAQQFPEAGTYAYSCYLHPTMNGVVVVGDGIGTGPVVSVDPPTPEPEPVAAVAPAAARTPVVEEAASSAGLAVAVGTGALVIGLGAGTFAGRRTRRPPSPAIGGSSEE